MQVLLKTNKGDIVIELDAKNAPQTTENFIKYVKAGQYEGTIFHRVIKGFMIQGGGMDAQMNERQTRAPIVNEADNGLKNDKYTIAMARTSDPHSATAQFFINTNNNEFLTFCQETYIMRRRNSAQTIAAATETLSDSGPRLRGQLLLGPRLFTSLVWMRRCDGGLLYGHVGMTRRRVTRRPTPSEMPLPSLPRTMTPPGDRSALNTFSPSR